MKQFLNKEKEDDLVTTPKNALPNDFVHHDLYDNSYYVKNLVVI